ncbi:MAG: chromosome segregation protein SMC [Hyphomicrobiales bacterium]|nr:MAG: chromosome segregation protein SMC [Hyphomicrobiales bacterium]
MHITRLRLLGFKSFVEPTELIIEKGLTGVVGPNGCGKSNLLEALRWVMGETSHKSMRAASMDDVIFNGTTNRPPRNMAEVTIFIDNSDRRAPAEFNDQEVLEITRRIEREAGSAYRVNGKDVRARDVRILFEDAATGARSPALVRQGQIAELVNAKPEHRRRILEDAAGIAGLHSRRHEAELRLKAAEQNLARIGDILGQLNSQLESLKRQARQARRYKEISAEIRKLDALVLHLRWTEAQANVATEEAGLKEALEALAAATEAEAHALQAEIEAASAIPALREEEAAKAAVLHRFKVEQENLEREAKRMADRQAELEARLAQLKRDYAREESLIAEAKETIARLDTEAESIASTGKLAAEFEQKALAAYDEAETTLKTAEQRLSALTTKTAEARAHRQSLERQRAERKEQVGKLERQLIALDGQFREIVGRAPDASKLQQATDLGQQLTAEVAEIEAQTVAAEELVHDTAEEAKSRSEASQQMTLAAGQLRTEYETLAKVLTPAGSTGLPPILDQVKVDPGYEMALAAALGDDLEAPVHAEAPLHWALNPPQRSDPSLPSGVEPLSKHVVGPPELQRRLAQIGLCKAADAAALQKQLKTGQRLVSVEGDLWRWDGYVAAAHAAASAAANRIRERARLGALAAEEEALRAEADAALAASHAAAERHRTAQAEEKRLRQLWRDTQARLAETRDQIAAMEKQARETETRIATVNDAKARTQEQLVDAHTLAAETEEALEMLSGMEELESELASAQQHASQTRNRMSETKTELISLEREHRARQEREAAIVAERQRWVTRSAGADEQLKTLSDRLVESQAEMDKIADVPALVEAQRQKLMTELAKAEQERQAAADRLAEAETANRQASQALRAAQSLVSDTREQRARGETRLENARARRAEEIQKIREQLSVAPEACLALAEIPAGEALPSLDRADSELQRLKADRERLGGVNLQADDDLVAMQGQYDSLDKDKQDVEGAIAKLRGGIGQINSEAQERLQSAFDTVNGHFQNLFTTLFGGGEARLEMIASAEDPLEGGLEIVAKPPGKKPATLSLLSGGEQTLTAMALIFAVFLTNPSPICVLDEVDAPLDDANVDRFCTLMEKMAADTATRFLVITHHPMTMTRMNRLFGVTMGEKGVSQLVSVDLETAQKFTAAA